jgi:hypothetical protein
MAITRLPETTLTVYAELLEQLRASSAIPRTGSFVSKVIAGSTYWYVQRVDNGRKRQIYIGPETPELLSSIRAAEERRATLADEERRRRELVAMLTAGGMAGESGAIGGVLAVLADGGLFHAGAVLVGTQAFGALANLLGVRFESQSLRTADVDVAHPAISLAVGEMRTDILEDLRASDPRFIAVPELDARHPSTSFKVRGRDLRVDLLTPGRESAKPVFLRHLNAAALPLAGLDYLIANPVDAPILAGSGILGKVPDPARFALHKLWVAQRRNVSEQAKSRKDIRQSAGLLEVLVEDRPGDVAEAWRRLTPSMATVVRRSVRALPEDLLARIEEVVGDAARSRR